MKKIDIDTWEKKVKVNNEKIPKKKVLDYYREMWKNKSFRDVVTKKGIFVRANYGNKSIIRRKNIRIKSFEDLKKVVHEHGVEFISPVKNFGYDSILDIDMPKKHLKNRKGIVRSVVRKLRSKGITVAEVTDAPRGAHIFSNTKKKDMKKALRQIAKDDDTFHIGKSSSKKVVLDPDEPNIAVPGSLSIKGKPYKKWRKAS